MRPVTPNTGRWEGTKGVAEAFFTLQGSAWGREQLYLKALSSFGSWQLFLYVALGV